MSKTEPTNETTNTFITIKEFARIYNLGYDSMRILLKKEFPKRKKGIMRPYEVKRMKEILENER